MEVAALDPTLVIRNARRIARKAAKAIEDLLDTQPDQPKAIKYLRYALNRIQRLVKVLEYYAGLEGRIHDQQDILLWHGHFSEVRDIANGYEDLAIRLGQFLPRKRDERKLIELADRLEDVISKLDGQHPETGDRGSLRPRRVSTTLTGLSEKFAASTRSTGQHRDGSSWDSALEVLHQHENHIDDVDVIFVHGLFGHGRATWLQSQTLWPKLLSEEIPNARIILCSYDTQEMSKYGYPESVRRLLRSIEDLRGQTRQRPVIFIAHSLGGILVKSILLESWRVTKEHSNRHPICRLTRGLVFLGTPHQATSLTAWWSLCRSIARATAASLEDASSISSLVESMAETASAESDDFKILVDDTRLSIVSFFETKGMDTTPWVPLKIVDQYTSLHHPREEIKPLVGTHISIAKFQGVDDPNYRRVREAIKTMIRPHHLELPAAIRKSTMIERSSAGASGEQFEDFPSQGPVPPIEEQEMTDLWSEFRKSMGPSRSFHRTSQSKHTSYVKWFIPTDEYQNWKTSSSNQEALILISGAVGSGKTALSCVVVDDLQCPQIESPTNKSLVLYFSFKEEERLTLLSKIDRQTYHNARYVLLQSLMAQILDSSPSLAGSMIQDKGQTLQASQTSQTSWSSSKARTTTDSIATKPREEVLLAMLRTILEDSCQRGAFAYCVIDAIDECDQVARFSVKQMLVSLLSIRGFKLMITCTEKTDASSSSYDVEDAISTWPEPFISFRLTEAPEFSKSMSEHVIRILGGPKAWQNAPNGVVNLNFGSHKVQYNKATTCFGSSSKPSDSFEFINVLKTCVKDFRQSERERLFDHTAKWPSLTLAYGTFFECLKKDPDFAEYASSYLTALEFMAWSYRPFRVSALHQALLICQDEGDHQSVNKTLSSSNLGHITDRMHGLLYLDGDGLHLASRSLRDFIQKFGVHKFRWREGRLEKPQRENKLRNHRRITTVCIKALLRDHTSRERDEPASIDASLLSYAEEHWREHRMDCNGNESDEIHRLSNDLLSKINVRKHHLIDSISLHSKIPTSEQPVSDAQPEKATWGFRKARFQLDLIRAILEEDNDTIKSHLTSSSSDLINQESLEPALRLAMRRRKTGIVEAFLYHEKVKEHFKDAQLLKMAVEEHSEILVDKVFTVRNPSSKEFGMSFVIAIRSANIPLCTSLLRHGFDVNEDLSGTTALHQAAYVGAVHLVATLVDWGARAGSRDKDGRQPMHCAAVAGHKDICLYLWKVGSYLEEIDDNGRTPLFLACAGAWSQTAATLLEAGCDPHHRDATGKSMLQVAAQKGSAKVVQRLLGAKCSVDSQDKKGRTAVHDAAEKGRASVVQLLLVHEASVALRDADGKTCLHFACTSGTHPEAVVRALLTRGADPNTRDRQGETALHVACRDATNSVAELLLSFGADPNIGDELGATPLHFACASSISPTAKVRTLLLTGVFSVVKADSSGDDPVSYARRRQQTPRILAELTEILRMSTGGMFAVSVDDISVDRGFAGLGGWTEGDESGFVTAEEPDDSWLSST